MMEKKDETKMTERQQLAFLLRQTANENKPTNQRSNSSVQMPPFRDKGTRRHSHPGHGHQTSSPKAADPSAGPRRRGRPPSFLKHPRPYSPKTPTAQTNANAANAKTVEGCAMCGVQENSPETLLLCKKCDLKYPTQRALGKVI